MLRAGTRAKLLRHRGPGAETLRRRLDPGAAARQPLAAQGEAAEHAIAFARGDAGRRGGHPAARPAGAARRLGEHLRSRCPHGHWRDLLTGGRAHRPRSPWRTCCPVTPSHYWKGTSTMFEVWAPHADRGRCGDRRGPPPDVRGRGGLVVGGGAGGRARHRLPVQARRRRAAARPPDPLAARGRSSGRAGSTTTTGSSGATTSGAGAACRGRSSTSCTSAPSPPRAPSTAAIGKLEHLVELGVDFVEIMPVPPVPGERNWGYDGVDLWAVTENYGGPDGLKRFVDACHRRGSASSSTSSTTTSARPGNFLPPFGPYFHAPPAASGGRRSTSTVPAPTRCAATSSATRCSGCATTTSTACGWTPCTRCTTSGPCTCWRSWPSRWTRCPARWAGR